MNVNIEESWKQQLLEEFEKPYFHDLVTFIKSEYQTAKIFPKGKDIFAAFSYCSFKNVKVIIIGQDPYHGPGQAHGLSFSVPDGIALPPSLKNIYREIEEDLGKEPPASGNLVRWAKQGVLLLNATLTVKAHQAGSHQNKGWEKFTDSIIETISDQKENVIFMLWGGYAKKKGAKINSTKHLILTSGHPSPLSANRGYWFGNKHFSQANDYLRKTNQKEIEW